VRPDRIVVTPPALRDDLSLTLGVEDFTVEQLVAQTGIEALNVAILPGAAAREVVQVSVA
jgi:hypothetical protein